jgi:hypothetical protein
MDDYLTYPIIFHDIVCEGEIMARGKVDQNASILEYALRHLERERDEIQTKIDHVRRQLGVRGVNSPALSDSSSAGSTEPRKKRVLSEAARKRIAAAQKRRWAEHRKAKAKVE